MLFRIVWHHLLCSVCHSVIVYMGIRWLGASTFLKNHFLEKNIFLDFKNACNLWSWSYSVTIYDPQCSDFSILFQYTVISDDLWPLHFTRIIFSESIFLDFKNVYNPKLYDPPFCFPFCASIQEYQIKSRPLFFFCKAVFLDFKNAYKQCQFRYSLCHI